MCDTSNFQCRNRTEGMFKVKIGNKEKLGLIAELLLMHSMSAIVTSCTDLKLIFVFVIGRLGI